MTEAEKRTAFESPAALARPEREDPRMPRPAAITVGVALVVLRVIAGAVWVLGLAALGVTYIEVELGDDGLDLVDSAEAETFVLAVILILGGILLLIDLALGVIVWFGVNWARITLLVFTAFSISVTFASWWVGDQEIHLDFTLVTLALDILLMLALSSEPARRYSRRTRRRA